MLSVQKLIQSEDGGKEVFAESGIQMINERTMQPDKKTDAFRRILNRLYFYVYARLVQNEQGMRSDAEVLRILHKVQRAVGEEQVRPRDAVSLQTENLYASGAIILIT